MASICLLLCVPERFLFKLVLQIKRDAKSIIQVRLA